MLPVFSKSQRDKNMTCFGYCNLVQTSFLLHHLAHKLLTNILAHHKWGNNGLLIESEMCKKDLHEVTLLSDLHCSFNRLSYYQRPINQFKVSLTTLLNMTWSRQSIPFNFLLME